MGSLASADSSISEEDLYKEIVEVLKPIRSSELKLKTPELYLDIFKVKQSKELPFCLVMRNVANERDLSLAVSSIKSQKYSNYEIAYSGPE